MGMVPKDESKHNIRFLNVYEPVWWFLKLYPSLHQIMQVIWYYEKRSKYMIIYVSINVYIIFFLFRLENIF